MADITPSTIFVTSNAKNPTGYLKWSDEIVGEILDGKEVRFIDCKIDERARRVLNLITKETTFWNEDQFTQFLTDRIVSRGRRDIEKILFKLGLVDYDAKKIAAKTFALNPKDLLWVSPTKEMQLRQALNSTFENIFKMKLDRNGETAQSPDGQNEKDYGVSNGHYGILKKRLSGVVTDAESEVAAYKLSKLLGVDVCPAWFVEPDVIFSKFVYNFTKDYLVHMRHYFADGEETGNRYLDLVNKFPELGRNIAQMCLFDFITRQDDRHLSNLAILNTSEGETLYPLYDNGRSLFYEDNQSFVEEAVKDVVGYCTTFGAVRSYYDAVKQIANNYKISDLMNLDISRDNVATVLKDSGFEGYRLFGSVEWITKALSILQEM